jgi:hypothetical protein
MTNTTKKTMPLWFKIVCTLSVVALMLVIGGILFTESWVGVVERQLNELKEGDIEQAYYLYTSKEFQITTPFDKFRSFIEAHPILFQKPSARFPTRSLHQNVSTLQGKLTNFNHKPIPIEYQLIKEGGKWKILSIHFIDHNSAIDQTSTLPEKKQL